VTKPFRPFSGSRRRIDERHRYERDRIASEDAVTLPNGELEVSAPQESSGRCDCGPPGGRRIGAKRTVRLG
jgi:hypothetical protein